MKKQVERILKQLDRAGFDAEKHRDVVAEKVKRGVNEFTFTDHHDKEPGYSMIAEPRIVKNQWDDDYRLAGYRMHVQKNLQIDKLIINGIDTGDLQQRMNNVNWGKNWRHEFEHFFSDKDEKLQVQKPVVGILADLWKLAEGDHPAGKEIRDRLMYYFLAETPFEAHYSLDYIRQRYADEITVPGPNIPGLDATYRTIRQRMERAEKAARPRVRKPAAQARKGPGMG